MEFITENMINEISDETLNIIADIREFSDDLTPPSRPKTELSAEIAQQTADFIASGGVITYLPYDDTAEREARRDEYRVSINGEANEEGNSIALTWVDILEEGERC